MLAFDPSWAGMHNYHYWEHVLGNCIFYYLLVLVIVISVRRLRRSRAAG